MDPQRKASRRASFERNLKRLRSSGRIKSIRKSGPIKSLTPPPHESDPFQAIVPDPSHEAELDALRLEVANLTRLQEVIHFLGGAPDKLTLRAEILDLAISISNLRRGMLALRAGSDEATRKFKVKATRGFDDGDASQAPETKVLRGILNRSLEKRETLLEGCMREGGILGHAAGGEALELGAVACLPLESNGELLGVLLLDDPDRTTPFTTSEESLLRSFARHAALALRRVSRTSRLKRKIGRVERRNERLEAENEAHERRRHKLDRKHEDLERTSERIRRQSERLKTPDVRAGRELRKLLGLPFSEARTQFVHRYLREVMHAADGDLCAAAEMTELPLARLIGLLEHLEVDVQRQTSQEDRPPTGPGWGSAVRR